MSKDRKHIIREFTSKGIHFNQEVKKRRRDNEQLQKNLERGEKIIIKGWGIFTSFIFI